MAVTKWIIANPTAMTSHTFAINPDPKGSAGEIAPQKKTREAQLTQDGLLMTFGQDTQLHGSFTVTVLTKDEYQALWSWWDQGALLHLTDDLGRVSTIYLNGFKAERDRKAGVPWFHTVSCDYVITALADI